MADPRIPILDGDIRFEDRGGVFVLVDPTLPAGLRDVAAAWEETPTLWRWRMGDRAQTGEPYPTATRRDEALTRMLAAYSVDEAVAARLAAQAPRFSFGEPQIVRAAPRAA